MSILVDSKTRLLTQGITGAAGKLHTLACRAYGTNVVGGVTPGRGGSDVEGIPVVELKDGSAPPRCLAFSIESKAWREFDSMKAGRDGDALTLAEFEDWLRTGFNRFDVR